MKSYEDINRKIEAGQAVVMDAEEVIDYVDRKGLDEAAEEIDVVTTATFGAMCSSGAFFNFGHSKPKIRITEAWMDDVLLYSGIASVDAFLGASQLRHNDPANMNYPGEFRFGGGHVMEKLIRGEKVQLFALSYGTDDYPNRELRTWLTLDDLNQAVMVNPRNCYQNYNVAVNTTDRSVYTYLGHLKPNLGNAAYSSAGQLSPLLNDPYYRTIGIGTSVWLAGARGHVHAEGTQHAPVCDRGENGVPMEGAGTLGLTGDMKQMDPEFVRGMSLKGYGASLALGIAIPIPILDKAMLRAVTVRDRDIYGTVIDYGIDYPQATGRTLGRFTYEQMRSGEIEIQGKKVPITSMSSYEKALKAARRLTEEIQRGDFLLSPPSQPLSRNREFKKMTIREEDKR